MRRLIACLITCLVFQGMYFTSVAQAESRQCAVVMGQVKAIFDGKYASEDSALTDLAKRTVKAYSIIFKNTNCLSKKNLREIKKGVQELRTSCLEAKKDEFSWAIMKGMCKIYEPLWKYAK